jgi:hypothetical protein
MDLDFLAESLWLVLGFGLDNYSLGGGSGVGQSILRLREFGVRVIIACDSRKELYSHLEAEAVLVEASSRSWGVRNEPGLNHDLGSRTPKRH